MKNRHTISDPANGRHDILDGKETQYGEDRDDRQEELRKWIDGVDTLIKMAEVSLDNLKKQRQHLVSQLGTEQCGS